MEKKDWIILQTVQEEKNITKAADRLFMSQPTLTYRLQQIEKEYDIKLLYRGRRGVEFTQQGEFLVKYADKMLTQLRDMEEELWNLGDNVRGTLRLSVARAIALYQLPKILRLFSEQHPKVDFNINTGLNLDLIQSIYKQDSHIGIVRGNHHWPYEKKIITEENICVISNKEIDIKDLPTMRRICYNTDPALNMVIDNWWKDNFSTPPLVTMNVDNMEIAKRMASNDLGYSIVPSIILEDHDKLFRINLTNDKGEYIKWTTWILYRKEFLSLSMVKEFVDFITNYFDEP
ncbi:LysR family transcriptional regulator [Metabacillus bambusae]|uniref:LysR family transcriptional regulator n=1 Tax=Metabacillus bambusae TaxID=2795218 RepID=A0ABS3N042_9BACI|nr:LysR family transcriptional regulator [Metabacillus bambusae]MBO1511494.1 LysR family transcriptional regulator [Metabacillus bambusae]